MKFKMLAVSIVVILAVSIAIGLYANSFGLGFGIFALCAGLACATQVAFMPR